MKFVIFAFCVAIGAGFGAAWLTSGNPQAQQQDGRPVQATLTDIPKGERLGIAEARLAALGLGRPTVEFAGEEQPAAPASFPEVDADIALAFRRDLTAIEQTADGPIVWVVDPNESRGRRAIGVGGAYQVGWLVSRIETQAVELRRRGETRRIELFETLQQP